MNTELIAEAEKQRLTSLLFSCNVSDERIKMLDAVLENVAWIKAKLDGTREAIKESTVVIPYDNGGGQKGLRENPLYKGYESLWKAYMSGMAKILDAIPNGEVKTEEKKRDKTMLEIVRERRRA